MFYPPIIMTYVRVTHFLNAIYARKSHTFSQCYICKNTITILDFCMISLEDDKNAILVNRKY